MMLQRSNASPISSQTCKKCGGLKLIKAESDGIYERYVSCECVHKIVMAEMWHNRNVPLVFDDALLSSFKAEYYSAVNRSKADYALMVAQKTVDQYREMVESFGGRGVYFHSA